MQRTGAATTYRPWVLDVLRCGDGCDRPQVPAAVRAGQHRLSCPSRARQPHQFGAATAAHTGLYDTSGQDRGPTWLRCSSVPWRELPIADRWRRVAHANALGPLARFGARTPRRTAVKRT